MDRKPVYYEKFSEIVAVKWMQPLTLIMLWKEAVMTIGDFKQVRQGFELT